MPYRSSLRRFGKNLVVPSADSGSSRPKSVFLRQPNQTQPGLAESFVARTLKGTWLLVVVGALLVLVGALLLPDVARAAVPAGVTKGLDYLHAHQRGDGGFSRGGSHSSASLTPWVTLAIAAGANDPALWRVEGHSPVTFLQATDLTSAAAASGNAPEYYALCILAYRAANRTDLLKSAGTTKLDLVAKLESYQSSEGYYSPAIPATTSASTETTAWAILGLDVAQQTGPPKSSAVTWLQTAASSGGGGPNADGGFGPQSASQSSTTVTSLVAQALVAGGVPPNNPEVQGAAGFIESMETSDGGFRETPGGSANALSTAWAIEGLHASGVDPGRLAKGVHTPLPFLGRCVRQTAPTSRPATLYKRLRRRASLLLDGAARRPRWGRCRRFCP